MAEHVGGYYAPLVVVLPERQPEAAKILRAPIPITRRSRSPDATAVHGNAAGPACHERVILMCDNLCLVRQSEDRGRRIDQNGRLRLRGGRLATGQANGPP